MKVCFVGAGSIGKRHIRNFHAVCGKRGIECRIHLFRSSHRKLEEDILNLAEKTVLDMQDLDAWYDAVFITNPTFKHYETILDFIDKSDYFFVEKPVFDRCDLPLAGILKKNKYFYAACPLRYTSVLMEAGKTVKDEPVLSARAISSSYLPSWRAGMDYRNTYSAHKKEGGGVRIDLIHEWDYLVSLFGFPKQVYCLDGRFSDLEIDCEDLAVYIAKYKDKLVELHLDYFGRKTRRNLEIRTNSHEYIFDLAGSRIFRDGELLKEFWEDTNDKYIREMEYFISFAGTRKKSANDLEFAMKVLSIAKES